MGSSALRSGRWEEEGWSRDMARRKRRSRGQSQSQDDEAKKVHVWKLSAASTRQLLTTLFPHRPPSHSGKLDLNERNYP